MVRPDYREIYHYGMPRRSGRYPYGSGERPFQSREERKEERENKKLVKKLNKQISLEEYKRLQKDFFSTDFFDKKIDKYSNNLDSILEELENRGVDLQGIWGPKSRSDGWSTWEWVGLEYHIKNKKNNEK